jgi:Calpain family cysteine protease
MSEVSKYNELKSKLSNGKLYEDHEFPTVNGFQKTKKGIFEWLRPKEICKNPEFQVGEFSRLDIKQGDLANCWFLAALGSLANNNDLFCKVVPDDNGSFKENYSGIFHFK